jgi:hypothetical protein
MYWQLSLTLCRLSKDPVDGRPQVRGGERFGEVLVHARPQAPLAILLPRPRDQRDNRQVASGRSLTLPDRPDHLEAVQLRHVDLQEQQVEGLALQQVQRLPPIDRHRRRESQAAQHMLEQVPVKATIAG